MTWKTIGFVVLLVLCSPLSVFCLNALQYVAAPEWLQIPFTGLFMLGTLGAFGFVILLIYLPIRLLREIFGDRQRHVLISTLVATLFLYGSMPLGDAVSDRMREKGLARTRTRTQPIIAALKVYKKKNGEYPQALNALVPDSLPSLPRTGSAVFPEFQYLPATDKTLFRSYELSIPTPSGPISFDRYLFWPEREYPDYYSRVDLKTTGDWVFLGD